MLKHSMVDNGRRDGRGGWTNTSVVEEGAIDHERIIGVVQAASEGSVLVRVAQRIDFDLIADPVTSRTGPARITVGGVLELTAGEALELSEYLLGAAAFVGELGPGDPVVS